MSKERRGAQIGGQGALAINSVDMLTQLVVELHQVPQPLPSNLKQFSVVARCKNRGGPRHAAERGNFAEDIAANHLFGPVLVEDPRQILQEDMHLIVFVLARPDSGVLPQLAAFETFRRTPG